ncbi:hypothetical protein ACP70R_025190 [Stipagrostis hirtigluma subsp. patula]
MAAGREQESENVVGTHLGRGSEGKVRRGLLPLLLLQLDADVLFLLPRFFPLSPWLGRFVLPRLVPSEDLWSALRHCRVAGEVEPVETSSTNCRTRRRKRTEGAAAPEAGLVQMRHHLARRGLPVLLVGRWALFPSRKQRPVFAGPVRPIYDQITAHSKHWNAARRMATLTPAAARPATVAMDYSLAALKVFGSQLAGSTEAPSCEGSAAAQMLFSIRFQRVWIQALTTCSGRQGVLLSADYNEAGEGRLVLDDGSCVADLFVMPKEAEGRLWRAGMYVLVIGAYVAAESKDNYPAIKVHKIVDLSTQPNREAMWYMEVAEAYNFFYLPFSVAGSPS